jgi:hypothetical protein
MASQTVAAALCHEVTGVTSGGQGTVPQRRAPPTLLGRTSSSIQSSALPGSSPPKRQHAAAAAPGASGLRRSFSTGEDSRKWSTGDWGMSHGHGRSSAPHREEVSVAVAASMLGDMFGGIFKGADVGESTRQEHAATVNLVNSFDSGMSQKSDDELREITAQLQKRARDGESMDSLLPVRFYNLCYFYFTVLLLQFFVRDSVGDLEFFLSC